MFKMSTVKTYAMLESARGIVFGTSSEKVTGVTATLSDDRKQKLINGVIEADLETRADRVNAFTDLVEAVIAGTPADQQAEISVNYGMSQLWNSGNIAHIASTGKPYATEHTIEVTDELIEACKRLCSVMSENIARITFINSEDIFDRYLATGKKDYGWRKIFNSYMALKDSKEEVASALKKDDEADLSFLD